MSGGEQIVWKSYNAAVCCQASLAQRRDQRISAGHWTGSKSDAANVYYEPDGSRQIGQSNYRATRRPPSCRQTRAAGRAWRCT